MKIKIGNVVFEDVTAEEAVELVNRLEKKTVNNNIISIKNQVMKPRFHNNKGKKLLYWTKSEDDVLFRHIGKSTVEHVKKLLPRRTVAAISFRMNGIKSNDSNKVSQDVIDRYNAYVTTASTTINS